MAIEIGKRYKEFWGGEWVVEIENLRQVKPVNDGLWRIGRGQESGIQNEDKKKDQTKEGEGWRIGYCALPWEFQNSEILVVMHLELVALS